MSKVTVIVINQVYHFWSIFIANPIIIPILVLWQLLLHYHLATHNYAHFLSPHSSYISPPGQGYSNGLSNLQGLYICTHKIWVTLDAMHNKHISLVCRQGYHNKAFHLCSPDRWTCQMFVIAIPWMQLQHGDGDPSLCRTTSSLLRVGSSKPTTLHYFLRLQVHR